MSSWKYLGNSVEVTCSNCKIRLMRLCSEHHFALNALTSSSQISFPLRGSRAKQCIYASSQAQPEAPPPLEDYHSHRVKEPRDQTIATRCEYRLLTVAPFTEIANVGLDVTGKYY